ncbi:putative quinol monooxygenase [Amnibacterium endophyticum]|uniref:Quinol monooxygenase n=1 Tax=Amnibacterium endophyticum TaxID=2109337 RepID=A0ABW4LAP5_9MICO
MAQQVVVVAVATPADGQADAVREALSSAVPKVHGEPGCELYALHEREDGAFVMIERWASGDALAVHAGGAHLAELNAALEGRLARPLDVTTMRALPAGDAEKGAL